MLRMEGRDFVFSSGRRVYRGEGLIGIGIDGDDFIGVGYDHRFDDQDELTADERRELADTMVAAWQHWVARGAGEGDEDGAREGERHA